jgi:hypothetical protein
LYKSLRMRYTTVMKFLFFIIMTTPAILFGQLRQVPVNISLFNESTAIPFTRFLTIPVHPGIQIGTEFNYKIKEYSRLFQTADICYFYHNYLAQGIGLHTELGYEYRLKNGIALSGLLGIGYMHTFATTEEFTFSDGKYEKKADRGNARLCPSFSVDIGYYVNNTVKNSLKIFIRYQSWAEYPYSPGFIPIMTHINLHAGVKLMIRSKQNENE